MRPYEILDVFTGTPLAGNPLAVVHEADGLSTDRMQAIAAEFNLSETIFLHAPQGDAVPARIFTPRDEMPFAGHPTVGGSIAQALKTGASQLALTLPAGRVDVTITGGDVRRATFDAPVLPRAEPLDIAVEDLARLVNLDPADIVTDTYRPARITSGPWFTAIPVRRVAALADARFMTGHVGVLGDAPRSLYLVAKGADGYRARMFAPFSGIEEDPATGSAAVALAAMVLAAETPPDGTHAVAIRQGVEMGRASDITISAEVAGGALKRVSLSGEAVVIARGTLLV
ncbi:PhzF family phenazine biosynthesis protein [Acuticoccus sediminis]|uniref:PhzF family phenazine biosynthesis protein n=1 Tax=Acuticoccus sediminis TaxID=2184697 RepID=UPI001CFD542B|nr:PhzF family phenazine biosynthesis protein [Acuticoccus sediminis]